ncbi:rod shape-determining protein MreC [Leptospira bouyouniensis]|uniref:Cell shape-determining protein MreC n=1 Tax=Leptospira bouyouniensis TaxID=2484911 RepID=A0ABY2L8K5_9LEPT|nr:rod shape-determining protein MreC [Leptospira bouyouniensis]TGK52975.1 rod shape-determining protein MreC [Leptospira bouyouniensis]TGM87191.1 rod shape-determining protein MreC [Leptospira bouyouniensis]
MKWNRINQNDELFSLLFVFLFSFTSLIWNGNFMVRGIASFQGVGDFFSGSFDSFGSLIKSSYNKLESFERVREERDSCLNVMEEYRQLSKDVERLKSENAILRQELNFPLRIEYPSVRAEVLSVRLNAIYRTIIINKGSESGIKPYMPVVARALDEKGKFTEALVGKIIAVSKGSAVIQPIINSNFSMGVSIPGTNLWASLNGNSGRGTDVLLDYIDSGIVIDPKAIGNFPMGPNPPPTSANTMFTEGFSKIGKAVYSSGGSGVFPPGIPVGTIIEEGPRNGSFKTAILRPFVEFDNLLHVIVLKKLPEKWREEWPAEKTIQIEGPYFGEIDFPKEKDYNKKEKKQGNQGFGGPSPFGTPNTGRTTPNSNPSSPSEPAPSPSPQTIDGPREVNP